jgi:class 3 adenylate cyclase
MCDGQRHGDYVNIALARVGERGMLRPTIRIARAEYNERRVLEPRSDATMFYSARPSSLILAVALAGCVFLIDTLSSLQFAVASLYVIPILIGAHDLRRRGIILTGLLCSLLTVLSYAATHGFALDGAAPLRSLVSLVSIMTMVILVDSNHSANERLQEAQRQRANLTRFFSPKIVEQLVEIDVPLSAARCQQAAVLFADIVGFTEHVSGKPPERVIQLLRNVLGLLSDAVFSYQGSIDKFLGDGLMAAFGLPLASPRDVTNAALCALEISDLLRRWNEENADNLEAPIRIAVGIHYGQVIQGDVGTEKRLEFTVIGDTVNIASRVEAYCRHLNAAVLVTDEFMQALLAEGGSEIAAAFSDEGKHLLRGRREPVHLYSVKADQRLRI